MGDTLAQGAGAPRSPQQVKKQEKTEKKEDTAAAAQSTLGKFREHVQIACPFLASLFLSEWLQ
jgi:hypothetical protein